MVSALDSGASGPGSSPGRGHCVVFLGRTLNTVPLSTQKYKYSKPLHATETGTSSGSYEPHVTDSKASQKHCQIKHIIHLCFLKAEQKKYLIFIELRSLCHCKII